MATSKQDKHSKKASEQRLYVSFWKIALSNFPIGDFRHRLLTSTQARTLVEKASKRKAVVCVSDDDLLAPYCEDELKNHAALCEVLRRHHGIPLAVESFFAEDNDAEGKLHFTAPLDFAEISGEQRLLVMTCSYSLVPRERRTKRGIQLEIEPDSVEFHLFETIRSAPTVGHKQSAGRKSLSQLFAESPLKGLNLEFARRDAEGSRVSGKRAAKRKPSST